jgi:hypothetical protein
MELKKMNALKAILVVSGMLFIISCGSEKKDTSKSDTNQKPEKVLNEFQIGDFQIGTEYDSLNFLRDESYVSPFGIVRSYYCLLTKENDTLILRATSYDSLPATPITDLLLGSVYGIYTETTTPEVSINSDSSAIAKFGDSLIWDFRIGKNYTVLIESNPKREIKIGELEIALVK